MEDIDTQLLQRGVPCKVSSIGQHKLTSVTNISIRMAYR